MNQMVTGQGYHLEKGARKRNSKKFCAFLGVPFCCMVRAGELLRRSFVTCFSCSLTLGKKNNININVLV